MKRPAGSWQSAKRKAHSAEGKLAAGSNLVDLSTGQLGGAGGSCGRKMFRLNSA